MITDSVRFRLAGDWLEWSAVPAGWHAYRKDLPARWAADTLFYQHIPRLRHLESGLLLLGNSRPTLAEFSLSRLLHGENGTLLESQAAVDAAIVRAEALLSEVVGGLRLGSVTRCDLSIHLPVLPSKVARFIKTHRHPSFRIPPDDVKRSTEYLAGRNHVLQGSGKRLVCYDKSLEQGQGYGAICRVELQLRNPLLRKLLGHHLFPDAPVYSLDYLKGYKVLRTFLLQFEGGEKFFGPYLPEAGPQLLHLPHTNPNATQRGREAAPPLKPACDARAAGIQNKPGLARIQRER